MISKHLKKIYYQDFKTNNRQSKGGLPVNKKGGVKMNSEKCLNCGHDQEITEKNVYKDELGEFTVCEKCDSSFDLQ